MYMNTIVMLLFPYYASNMENEITLCIKNRSLHFPCLLHHLEKFKYIKIIDTWYTI